jgi:hypothetical protein
MDNSFWPHDSLIQFAGLVMVVVSIGAVVYAKRSLKNITMRDNEKRKSHVSEIDEWLNRARRDYVEQLRPLKERNGGGETESRPVSN